MGSGLDGLGLAELVAEDARLGRSLEVRNGARFRLALVVPALIAVAKRQHVIDGRVHYCRVCQVAGPTFAHAPGCEVAALSAKLEEVFVLGKGTG